MIIFPYGIFVKHLNPFTVEKNRYTSFLSAIFGVFNTINIKKVFFRSCLTVWILDLYGVNWKAAFHTSKFFICLAYQIL
jgi:hypothetical protein